MLNVKATSLFSDPSSFALYRNKITQQKLESFSLQLFRRKPSPAEAALWFSSHPVQMIKVSRNRCPPRGMMKVGHTKFFASLAHNWAYQWVVRVRNAREQVMLDLVVESTAEPCGEPATNAVVGRSGHLKRGPVFGHRVKSFLLREMSISANVGGCKLKRKAVGSHH